MGRQATLDQSSKVTLAGIKRIRMRAIKKVKKLIESSPSSLQGLIFARLILALESGHEFPVKDLYKLNLNDFDLAIELMRDWRIDRFYIGKAKAFDTATHAANLS
jgi:hypothetical protein